MSDNILDLRQNNEFAILIDRGTIGNIIWSTIPTLDTGYTVTINDESGSTVNTYVSGSGITLGTTDNSITWSFGAELASGSTGEYYARIESDSKELGPYLRIFFKVQVEP
jgi:hypothetical protein